MPMIENQLCYKKFLLKFQTLERPVVKKNKKIHNNLLKEEIKKIKSNVLIIGSSQGLGRDIVKGIVACDEVGALTERHGYARISPKQGKFLTRLVHWPSAQPQGQASTSQNQTVALSHGSVIGTCL